MNFNFFFSLIFYLNFKIVKFESINETEILKNSSNGLELVIHSLNILFNGESVENSYKDLFIDTSKSLLEHVDSGNDMVTVDDMLRIFFQSVIILVACRRPDLIPKDFLSRHEVYATFVNELNKILDALSTNGTEKVTFKDFRLILKTVKSNEFWDSVYKLKQEVDNEIKLEEKKELEKNSNQEL